MKVRVLRSQPALARVVLGDTQVDREPASELVCPIARWISSEAYMILNQSTSRIRNQSAVLSII